MQGTTLYPLNTLKDIWPTVFREHSKKYEGRQQIQYKEVPGLGKWNDVIHLSPIDPGETRQALRDAGVVIDSSWKVFCIDAGTLDASRLVLHIDTGVGIGEQDLNLPLSEKNYANYRHLPGRTKEYYRQCVKEGRQALIYAFTPHVLYGEPIDVSAVEVREYAN